MSCLFLYESGDPLDLPVLTHSFPTRRSSDRRDRESLERLAGVGRKTANVVLNIAFGEPTIAVDTHIFRVGNRTGLAPGKTPLEVERRSEEHTSELQSLMRISYAVFCLKKKKTTDR